MNKEFTMELEFKEPLTPQENQFLENEFFGWGVKERRKGLFFCYSRNEWPLYAAMITILQEMKSIILKASKCIIHGSLEPNDDLLEGWKEDGRI